MKSIEPGMFEYEAEALIEYIFRRNGAEYPGFPSIVGSGENAVVLHYDTNRRQMQADDMVVIDIGAEYHGYTADVTRTLPVDGVFHQLGAVGPAAFTNGDAIAVEVFDESTLDPLSGAGRYNHLSVRSAVSIILDRVLGGYARVKR